MIKVFIAMPYGDHNTTEKRLQNTEQAMDVWTTLADAGFAPFCPHLSHFIHERCPRDRTHWLAQTSAWVASCDCLLASGESEGVLGEVKLAVVHSMPVFRSIKALADAYKMEI